jgi:serine/threonine-protein kinase
MANTSLSLSLADDFISKFQITNPRFIGEGSQKRVFCVEKDGQKCILKLFKDFGIRDLRELDIYDKYNSLSGIPKILEIQKFNDETVVFEEEIEGSQLEDIKTEYISNGPAIKELLLRVVGILEPLWTDNIVHRDLKPSNILVREGNMPTVIDFGIAKNFDDQSITTVSFQPHTWKFAAPEQFFAQKDNISYRTDFFAIGVIAYYLYFQELPFGNTREDVENYFAQRVIDLSVNDSCGIKDLLINLLKYSPSERPAKITKVRELLSI